MADPVDLERRLADVVGTIQEFAELHFEARAPVGPAGDIVDAVAAGVNFLGEELDASFREIERRVADRTAELAIATQDLSRRALHDELTGLSNRPALWEHLTHRLALANRRESSFAVLFLDIDDFKLVNDTLGHATGDRLLIEVAGRLVGALRAGDTVARVGGDEFVILLDEVATPEAALFVSQRLNEALLVPYDLGHSPRLVTASIGVAIGPGDFDSVDELVAAADTAMYEAKRHGGGGYVLYSEDLHGRHDRRPPSA